MIEGVRVDLRRIGIIDKERKVYPTAELGGGFPISIFGDSTEGQNVIHSRCWLNELTQKHHPRKTIVEEIVMLRK